MQEEPTTTPPILGEELPYQNADGETDAEKGAKLGGLGGLVTGAVAGAMLGPGGALIGALVGGMVGGVASGVAVAAVDKVDGDAPLEPVDSEPVSVHLSVKDRIAGREHLAKETQ